LKFYKSSKIESGICYSQRNNLKVCFSMIFGCFDTMIVFLDGIVRRARGPSIYKKAPAQGDRSSILVRLLLEKPRLTRELFLSGAQFAVVVSYPSRSRHRITNRQIFGIRGGPPPLPS